MAQSRWWSWRSFTMGFGFAAIVAVVATGMAQPATDKWWPGYSGGPDNSRFFQSRQISKANVNQLQVAWTYPFGDKYLLVPAAGAFAAGRGAEAGPAAAPATGPQGSASAPLGWVVYTLPEK